MKKNLSIVAIFMTSALLFGGNYSRSNDIVTDHSTNLQWLDQPNTKAELNAYNQTDPAKQSGKVQKWINAAAYCKNLTYAGGGWYLPNRNELESLVDKTHASPAIDPIFKNTESLGYWTSVTYSDNTSQAWGIGFNSGGWHHCNKSGRAKFIRCVRKTGNPPPSSSSSSSSSSKPASSSSSSSSSKPASSSSKPSSSSSSSSSSTPLHGDYTDDFSTNTIKNYNKSGSGKMSYDSSNQRAHVTTSGSTGFAFSHALAKATDGTFSIDVNPVSKNSSVGIIELRLIQNANTYYKIINRNGGSVTGGITKYVNGKRVDSAWFKRQFVQGRNYTIKVSFSPSSTMVEAFGQTLIISSDNTAVSVQSMTVKMKNQNTNVDNIEYNVIGGGSSSSSSSNSSSSAPSTGGFSDDFSTNTIKNYNKSGSGKMSYDSSNQRAHVTTSGSTGFAFSHALAKATDGTFSIDVNPVSKNSSVGIIELRLIQNANTYYKIINRNGGSVTGGITKYVNGKRVDSAWFKRQFVQGRNYTIKVSFSPSSTMVEAFGQTRIISRDNTPLAVKSFTVTTKNQNANYDNIEYND